MIFVHFLVKFTGENLESSSPESAVSEVFAVLPV